MIYDDSEPRAAICITLLGNNAARITRRRACSRVSRFTGIFHLPAVDALAQAMRFRGVSKPNRAKHFDDAATPDTVMPQRFARANKVTNHEREALMGDAMRIIHGSEWEAARAHRRRYRSPAIARCGRLPSGGFRERVENRLEVEIHRAERLAFDAPSFAIAEHETEARVEARRVEIRIRVVERIHGHEAHAEARAQLARHVAEGPLHEHRAESLRPLIHREQADFHRGKRAILHAFSGQERMLKRDSVRQQRHVSRKPPVVLPRKPALPRCAFDSRAIRPRFQ